MSEIIKYSPATDFLALLKTRTRQAYALDLRIFETWLNLPPRNMSLRDFIEAGPGEANMTVMQYRKAMMDVQPQPLKPASINHRLTAIRTLLTHLRRTGIITWAIDVPGLKNVTYKNTRGPTPEQVDALLTAALRSGHRNYAILLLLCDNGLRREEVASIGVNDLDLIDLKVRILGKGDDEKKWLPINEPTRQAIQEWLAIRKIQGNSLFGITGRAVHLIVSRLAKSCGFKGWPHGLRHFSITRIAIKSNGNAYMTQAHARHKSAATTTKYLDNLNDLQRQAVNLAGED